MARSYATKKSNGLPPHTIVPCAVLRCCCEARRLARGASIRGSPCVLSLSPQSESSVVLSESAVFTMWRAFHSHLLCPSPTPPLRAAVRSCVRGASASLNSGKRRVLLAARRRNVPGGEPCAAWTGHRPSDSVSSGHICGAHGNPSRVVCSVLGRHAACVKRGEGWEAGFERDDERFVGASMRAS